MRIIDNPPLPDSSELIFEKGDFIVPNTGVMWSFYWKDGAILRTYYKYHKATPAEIIYFWKRIFNGYPLLGAENKHDLLAKNFNRHVKNYKDL